MKQIDFSVVVPVFNSERSLAELYEGIRDTLTGAGYGFEIIFVDDGSADGSWQVLRELKERDPDRVTAVRLSKNFGQHNATFCGFGFARGASVITIDDDLQIPPSEMLKLVSSAQSSENDIIYGVYGKNKKHAVLRNIGSQSLKQGSRLVHNGPGDGSSFRLIKTEIIKKILEHQRHFLFIDEILQWYTDLIGFVLVDHFPRKYEQSGYSYRSLIRMFGEIIIYYTTLPLKLLVYGGMTVSVITLFIGLYFILKKIFFNVPLGYTSLIVTILFSTSILLFSLGVIGEYLRRIYIIQNQKPSHSIRKIL
jgi:polyisoprenyl-phosphate glycosyltransferase